jgi:hypothetical protein
MVRGPFDEAIFWNLRILKAWEDNPALVLPKPAASICRPCCVETVRCRRSLVPVLRSGTLRRRLPDQQSLEVKGHGLQEGRKLILRHPSIAHPLRPLGKDPFIRSPEMGIPPVPIAVLGFHVVAVDRGEMTAPLGGGLTGWSRTIAFLRIHRALRGTHMQEALGLGKIRRGRVHFVDEAGLHIHLPCSL